MTITRHTQLHGSMSRFAGVRKTRNQRAAILELLEARQMLSGEGPGGGSIVFVGSDVTDRAGVAALFADAEVVMLESGHRALTQISEVLAGRSGLDTVQIFSHGKSGSLELGGTSIDAATLATLAGDIAGWGKALAPDGDILLWGCNVGEGTAGLKFVREFARLTGADVAASTTVTGAASLGGDWVLERVVGNVSQRIAAPAFEGYTNTLGVPPQVFGAVAGQTVDDDDTLNPFASILIDDFIPDPLDVTVALDDAAKGVFTPASLTASGFTDLGSGVYRLLSTDMFAATIALRSLVFDPSDNRVAVGNTETTTFTITVDDGVFPPTVNSTTTVISTSVNDLAVIGGTVAGQAVNDDATILPFTGVTFSDADNPAQIVDVMININDANGLFTTASLIAAGFFNNFNGLYMMTGTLAAAQNGIRQLVFNPTNDRVAPGAFETTTFTITIDDGLGTLVTDNTTTVDSTSVNDNPTVSGSLAAQPVNDDATVTPFAGVTIGDADHPAQTQTVMVWLDDATKGVFTPASLSASGFADAGGGVYTFSGDAAAATTAIRQLVFDPTNNRALPGATETTTFTISVNDGVGSPALDSVTTVVSTSINDVPVIGGTVAGQMIDDNDTVLLFAGVTITDNDAMQTLVVAIAIDDAAKGEFTAESLTASGFIASGSGVYQFSGTAAQAQAAIRLLDFAPADARGPLGSTETSTFMITIADSLATPVMDNTTTVISTATNNLPTMTTIDTLQGATARLTYVITYADLLAASDAADPDSGDVLVFRVETVVAGQLFKNGEAVTAGVTTLGVGETLEWRSAPGASGVTQAFTVTVTDGSAFSDPAGVGIEVAASDPATAAEGGNVAVAVDANGLTTVVTRNDAGELVVLQQDGADGEWVRVDLSGLTGIDGITGDPQVFVDPSSANNNAGYTYIAITTSAGLILVWNDGGEWTTRNISLEVASPAIVGNLITFTTIDNRQVLAGFSADGDLVINIQGIDPVSPAEASWQGENLYELLRNQSEATPVFTSVLVPYVTSWNGLNIAGLDADGNIWTVWTGGDGSGWHSSNISEITGAPALVGNVSAYTTSWGGINIAGIDTNGDLTISWWVPTFGAEWVNSNMSELFGGPDLQPGSMTAYVTPWNALNVAGLDADGNVVQYWWVPPPEPDVWNIDNLTEDASISIPRFVGRLTGLASLDSRMNLVGQSEEGRILRLWWSPTSTWELQDLTALI